MTAPSSTRPANGAGEADPTHAPPAPSDLRVESPPTDGRPLVPWPSYRGRFSSAWREGARTRAEELRSLAEWLFVEHHRVAHRDRAKVKVFSDAIEGHLDAARAAVEPGTRRGRARNGARIERATSSLDAVEADILQIAPASFILGQMPTVLHNVRRHLRPTDPRRIEVERIAKSLGLGDPTEPVAGKVGGEGGSPASGPSDASARCALVESERPRIVSAVRGAASAALREQNRIRSFRNVLVACTVGMAAVALGLGFLGVLKDTALPVCFAPEQAGQIKVVCPIQQSGPQLLPGQDGAPPGDIDDLVDKTVRPGDIFLVELIGMTAAAVSAAGAVRNIRGSSEPYGVPIALAVLKLPTGALTAMLGLLLMRGGFVPGLSALDTSAQILAWAILFGYAQQLFTRLVDQQAHTVLDGVRGGPNSTVPAAI
jgi:hypothetical protein